MIKNVNKIGCLSLYRSEYNCDLLARRSQVLKLPLFDIVTYVLWCYVSPIYKMMVAMKD